tara:strand:+ start:192 stop:485 length:294 start_codon:yes stop_codon:yes gene_type:complete
MTKDCRDTKLDQLLDMARYQAGEKGHHIVSWNVVGSVATHHTINGRCVICQKHINGTTLELPPYQGFVIHSPRIYGPAVYESCTLKKGIAQEIIDES